MAAQVMNPSLETEEVNAWSQFNELKNSEVVNKKVYRFVNNEEFEEFDEETLVDSAWSKFCEMKTNTTKKPEYKRVSKQEEIIEEIDGAWKEFIENKGKDTKKAEYVKVNEEKVEDETEPIDGAWKEFMDKKNNGTQKVEYIKVTEEEINEDETSEEEYEKSAWNNFKSIESEEKIKRQTIKYETKKKPEMVKMHLADCAWNEFVTSDKELFDKYEKSLERLEDDIIITDETLAEEELSKANSIENEGETTMITNANAKVLTEDIKKEIMNEVEKVEKEIKEETKIVEDVKEEIKEEIKPVEEIKPTEEVKTDVKEEVRPVEEKVSEVTEEVKSDKKNSKKGKFSRILKKTKKMLKTVKKVFSHKKEKKNQN